MNLGEVILTWLATALVITYLVGVVAYGLNVPKDEDEEYR